MNSEKIAAALRLLADAIETPASSSDLSPQPSQEPPKRGRGRPPKETTPSVAAPSAPATEPTEATPAPTATASASSATPSDPFAQPAPKPQPSIEEVMDAARKLSAATTQQNAVDVLKAATGASNRGELKPEQHAAALAALTKALPQSDPFAPVAATPAVAAAPTAAVAVQSDAPTIDAVKAAIRDAQKITGVDTVQRVIMDHGGKKPDANSPGGWGPSVQALSVSSYATVIAALKALPKTK